MIVVLQHRNFSLAGGGASLQAYNFITASVFDGLEVEGETVDTETAVEDCELQVENFTGVDTQMLDSGVMIPGHFVCPISMEAMRDPVVACDGHTYEKTFLLKWFVHNNKSPATNVPLRSKHVVPNFNLRSAIAEWFQEVKRQRGESAQ